MLCDCQGTAALWTPGNQTMIVCMQSYLKTDNAKFVQWRLMEEPCQIKSTQVYKHRIFFFFGCQQLESHS